MMQKIASFDEDIVPCDILQMQIGLWVFFYKKSYVY